MIAWTPELDLLLRQMHAEGRSYSRIAAEFGTTKNAISGRALRLNLPKRERPIERQPAAGAPKLAVAPRSLEAVKAAPPPQRKPPAPPIVGPQPPARPIARRTRTCQFILGAPRGTATRFCDAPTLTGSSYCPEHHALCWSPPLARELRPR